MAVHNSGECAKYTRSLSPVEAVYWEACAYKSATLHREAELKRLPWVEKPALIECQL